MVDVSFEFKTDAKADRDFAAELERSGRVVLPINLRVGEGDGATSAIAAPIRYFADHVELGVDFSFPTISTTRCGACLTA